MSCCSGHHASCLARVQEVCGIISPQTRLNKPECADWLRAMLKTFGQSAVN
ncbi:MAG: hypothetical protein ACI841_003514 [Planctomycetota bacterium]|jgi:hypothetical protein